MGFENAYRSAELAAALEALPECSSALEVDQAGMAAKLTLLANQPERALECLALVNQDSRSEESFKLLGEAYARLEQWGEAAGAYEKAGLAAQATKFRWMAEHGSYVMENASTPTVIPMMRVDPLPVVSAKVDGKPINLIVDTGGGELILDDDLTRELGLRTFGSQQSTFAADQKAMIEHAVASLLELGDARLANIPVKVKDTSPFAAAGGGLPIHGVLGTTVLRRFLYTLDYPNAELILKPFSDGDSNQETNDVSIPIWLAGDHLILAHGRLNNEPTLMLIDTGLAGLSFTGTLNLIERAGVKIDGQSFQGIGGGGAVTVTPFQIDQLSLGDITRSNQIGVAGPFPSILNGYWDLPIEGLISHAFFRPSAVTFDFEKMELRMTSDQ